VADHYTRLLEWRREESAARGLHKLPHDFYASTQAYLAETRATFESELRNNPAGKKGDLARQTYQRAAQIARDIVEARMMKILTLAFQASVGTGREMTNALGEERALFDRLVESLRAHRQQVAPFLEPSGAGTATAVPTPPSAGTPSAAAPSSAPSHGPTKGTVLVRILRDAPPIELGTGTLELRREDVLDLPAEAAKILIQAQVAERIAPAAPPQVT
jgi:DNA replication initiation complex subunit (GINS family)